jgi:4-hydroxy-tetrahydrodipicolinate reductase
MHPALDLAGVLVHSEQKSGRDAGELFGAPATGVLATRDPDALLACAADSVVYAPRIADLDEVCALLRFGRNVVCTPFLFHRRPNGAADRV